MIAEKNGKFIYNGKEYNTFDEAWDQAAKDRKELLAKREGERRAQNDAVKRSYRLIGRKK